MRVVLDTWPVLRYLQNEHPVADQIEQLLERERPIMSWMNVGETLYVLRREFGGARADEAVRDLRTYIDPDVPSPTRVLEAARIKADCAMSYADAFAAATAVACHAELWTGDPELLVEDAPWRWRDLRSV